MTQSETAFDLRAKTGFFLGPIAALLVYFLPLDLAPKAHLLSSVIAWVVIWWVCETLPLAITAMLGVALAILLGVSPVKPALASFAHPIVFLFMGGFFIAKAMEVHNLDRRIALFILTRSFIMGRPKRTLSAFLGITAFLSMWISNTATTAMLLPIAIGVLGAVLTNYPKHKGGALISVAWASSIGGIVTPVGSTPNIIGLGLLDSAGINVSFLHWMALTLPISVLTLLLLNLLMKKALPKLPEQQDINYIRTEYRKLGKLKRGEKNCLMAAAFAVIFWISPSILAIALGTDHIYPKWFKSHMPEAVTAMLAAGLLFILPMSKTKPTLQWKDASKIDWNSLLLFGGGISLGVMMFNSGLAQIIGNSFVELSGGGQNFWLFVGGAVLVSIFLTELVSNTATASMLIPLVIAASQQTGFNPIIPTLGVATACSFAFMMPVSTPPNAIVYGSGLIPLQLMMRGGFVMNMGGFGIIMIVLFGLSNVLGS